MPDVQFRPGALPQQDSLTFLASGQTPTQANPCFERQKMRRMLLPQAPQFQRPQPPHRHTFSTYSTTYRSLEQFPNLRTKKHTIFLQKSVPHAFKATLSLPGAGIVVSITMMVPFKARVNAADIFLVKSAM